MFVFIESHLHKFSYEHKNEMDIVSGRETRKKVKHIIYNMICNLLNAQRTFVETVIRIVCSLRSMYEYIALGISAKSTNRSTSTSSMQHQQLLLAGTTCSPI